MEAVFQVRQSVFDIEIRHSADLDTFFEQVDEAQVSPQSVSMLLARFRALDEVYLANEMVFGKEIRESISQVRVPINKAIIELYTLIPRGPESKQDVSPDLLLDFTQREGFLSGALSYGRILQDSTWSQIQGFMTEYDMLGFALDLCQVTREKILRRGPSDVPVSKESDDTPISKETWSAFVRNAGECVTELELILPFLPEEARNKFSQFMTGLRKSDGEETSLDEAELIIRSPYILVEMIDESIDILRGS